LKKALKVEVDKYEAMILMILLKAHLLQNTKIKKTNKSKKELEIKMLKLKRFSYLLSMTETIEIKWKIT